MLKTGTQDLKTEFDLEKNKKLPILEDWLSATTTFDDYTIQKIEKLKLKVLDFVD